MAVTQERFAQGLTYEEYKGQMTRNRERFDANEETVALNANDLAFFAELPQPINALVIAEDWCGDVIANLPVLGRLAAESGKLNVRVFLRDQNLDLIDSYLKEGKFRSIPVFVLFDEEFNEFGHWIERPASVTAAQAEWRKELYAQEPLLRDFTPDTPVGQLPEEARLRLSEAYSGFRESQRTFSDQEVVRDIRGIVERGVSQTESVV